jgi:hypothetical protein
MSDEVDIFSMKRSDIRYALFRNRSGNPNAEHRAVLEVFAPYLEEYELSISGFSETWDVGVQNPLEIVSGHQLIPIKKETAASLFNADGSLKE